MILLQFQGFPKGSHQFQHFAKLIVVTFSPISSYKLQVTSTLCRCRHVKYTQIDGLLIAYATEALSALCTRDSAQRNDNSKENQGVQRFYTTTNGISKKSVSFSSVETVSRRRPRVNYPAFEPGRCGRGDRRPLGSWLLAHGSLTTISCDIRSLSCPNRIEYIRSTQYTGMPHRNRKLLGTLYRLAMPRPCL